MKRYFYVGFFACFMVWVWVGWANVWDASLWGDNIEQTVWVHHLALGYPKHPPMPTWLLAAAMWLIGGHWWLTNVLAGICFSLTGVLTWLIARRLCNETTANIAIVLWSLQQSFSLSAQLYNHNSVMVLFVAALVYSAIRASDTPQSWRWWLLCGVLAAGGMMSKYQAAVPLISVGAVILLLQRPHAGNLWRGAAITLAVCVFLLLPHFYWAYVNDFPTLRYASDTLEAGNSLKRLTWVASFAGNQLRMISPLLLACLVAWIFEQIENRRQLHPPTRAQTHDPQASERTLDETTLWLRSLLWGPLVFIVLASLLTGSVLRNHWGVQFFQFFAVWLAWRWRDHALFRLPRLVWIALSVHMVMLVYDYQIQTNPLNALAQRRADLSYPAQRMTEFGLAQWRNATRCPLRYVVGDFEAGLISVYSGIFPTVYTSPHSTPWVNAADLEKYGALYALEPEIPLPPNVIAVKNWPFFNGNISNNRHLQFAVQLPAQPCP